MKYRLSDIAEFNPRESIKKGSVAKKIAMDKLQPFCRDIPEYEYATFSGGTKFRNGDTIMARITPCLKTEKLQKLTSLMMARLALDRRNISYSEQKKT